MLFIERFLETARWHKNATAILEKGQETTYGDLLIQAQKIAAYLHQERVTTESLVGLHIRKSKDYVAALLGVWLAGAAFIPIDPDLPLERKKYIVADSRPHMILSEITFSDIFLGTTTIVMKDIPELTLPAHLPITQPEQLAYVIYTSGSTGEPKGVMVEHRGLVPVLDEQIKLFDLGAGKRSLFLLSISFDASISDIGTALLSGATLCIEPKTSVQSPEALTTTLSKLRINYLDLPPSLLQSLCIEDMPSSLQTIVIGGEVCSPETVRQWAQKYRLINVYGPTEATICSSMIQCNATSWDRPLIGIPLNAVTYRVLDDCLNDVAEGQEGELYIAGPILARGYLNKPDLTATKFITHKCIRYYKTGDKIKVCPDGNHEFLGRIDRQFKIRGQLVEPVEIETCISRFENILRVAVLKRSIDPSKPNSREILVAFIQPKDGQIFNPLELRRYLDNTLPPWMVPQKFVKLEKMPETASGKPDFQVLLHTDLSAPGNSKRTHTPTSEKLADLIAMVLRIRRPSPDDEFYSLGGDSLSTLDLVIAAERQGIYVTIDQLARRSSIFDLASTIDAEPAHGATHCHQNGAIAAAFLDKESYLPADIRQKISSVSQDLQPLARSFHSIFLTGASGFFGSRLLHDLLHFTDAHIYCLTQASTCQAALLKLQATSNKYGVLITPEEWQRVTPVCGNIAQPQMGLSGTEWQKLSRETDVIYHCAATVNLVHTYEQLKDVNLGGTQNIVHFALEGKRKPIHYASTLSVFVATDHNSGTVYEADHLDTTRWIYGGYAQTKWAAERFLRQVAASLPINIFRLGFIAGDTNNPINPDNSLLKIFAKGITSIGCIPEQWLDRLYIDLTPRDYATKAMTVIAKQQGGKQGNTFHIANPQSIKLRNLIEAMILAGRTIELVDEGTWLRRIKSLDIHSLNAATLLSLCRGNEEDFGKHRLFDLFQASGINFDQSNTNSSLKDTGLKRPLITTDLMHAYIKNLLT